MFIMSGVSARGARASSGQVARTPAPASHAVRVRTMPPARVVARERIARAGEECSVSAGI